jgi:aminoglycoside phosphotransferase (APT) family kinase protein
VPFISLPPPLIADLLRPVFGACTLDSAEPLTGGRANTNYRVKVAESSQLVVLRIYTRDPDACSRDAALFRLVRNSVPVPELLWADPSCSRFDWPYAVLRWVEHRPWAQALGDAPGDVGWAVGKTLASIGGHTFPRAGFLNADLAISHPATGEAVPFLDHMEQCLTSGAADQLGEPLATEVRSFVRRNAHYLPPEPRPAALVHGDFKEGNILLHWSHDAWHVAAVLDWEFAFAGPSIFDLSILLRHSHALPAAFEQGAVAGFTETGAVLPPDWKRTTRLLDFVNLLDFLRTPGREAALVSDVVDLMCRTIHEWETLG